MKRVNERKILGIYFTLELLKGPITSNNLVIILAEQKEVFEEAVRR